MEGISWGCLVQHVCSEQGYLELIAQNPVQMAFDYLQAWRLHFSGRSVPVLDHSYSKKPSPHPRRPLCFNIILNHFTIKTILTKLKVKI